MKSNLKNFPECDNCKFKATSGTKCRALKDDICPKDEWKINGEKELREMKKTFEDIGPAHSMRDNVKYRIAIHNKLEMIKEILGE